MHSGVNIPVSNPAAIERQLASMFKSILSRAKWLERWTVQPARRSTSVAGAGWDLIASGPLPNGKKAVLFIECKVPLQARRFASLADRPCSTSSLAGSAHRVLGMPRISPRMASLCEENGWNWFDLAGNCRVEIPGAALIERSGQECVRIKSPTVTSLSSPEAASVIRALLAPEHADKRWTQRGIVAHFVHLNPALVQPSLALVNKVVQHLRNEAFLEQLPNRGFKVRDHEAMLELWRQHYRFDLSTRRRYFTLLQPRALSDRLRALGVASPGSIAYGVFSAAEAQALNVRQPRTWLYVDSNREDEVQKVAEAKEVDSGENLVVLIPHDPGIFYQLDATHSNRLACTNPVQTYIDLTHAGGRGEEAAEAVLQQCLKPAWKTGAEK